TSMGFAASFFLSLLAAFVPSVEADSMVLAGLLVLADAEMVCGGSSGAAALASAFLSFPFGTRVVTLAKGTVSAFVLERVSISAVTDIPGLNCSFSLMRILTLNFVTSC